MNEQAIDWQDLEHQALTDVGLRRRDNEDSLGVWLAENEDIWREKGHLFVVADGMGAHAAGKLASQTTVDSVLQLYREIAEQPSHRALDEAIQQTNQRLHDQAQASDDLRGMGTTVTSLLLLPQGALVAHVGDSRVYRLRGKLLEQLTSDHSLLWEVCASRGYSHEEAARYIPQNIVTRSIGPLPNVQVDLEGPFELQRGDIFLLCSDGLSGAVNDRELGSLLGCLSPSDAVHALVDLAVLRGGHDNITAIVVRVGRARDPRTDETDGIGAADQAVGQAAAAERLGKAPYAEANGAPDEAFVAYLSQMCEQLRTAAETRSWNIDWPDFNARVQQAADAAREHNHEQAIRDSCRAIRSVFSRLRDKRGA